MEGDFKEQLKNALLCNDIEFLTRNSSKFSVNERFEEEDNDTLLLYSLSDAKSEVYKYLIKNKADLSLVNDLGENVIHSAVFSGKPERLNGIINSQNINKRSIDGVTPLLLAISMEKYDIAIELIKLGADVNIPDNEDVYPIHIACIVGNLSIVSELVNRGASLTIKSAKGNLPLALAVNEGHDDIVKFLFEKIYG